MKYNLAQVLTITHSCLLIPMTDLHDTLNSMVDGSLFTHQLVPAADAAQLVILDLYPELEEIVIPKNLDSFEKIAIWLDKLYPIYGNSFEVPRVEVNAVDLDELLLKFMYENGPDKVIVVEIPEETE